MESGEQQHQPCLIHNARLVTPFEVIPQGWLRIENGRIAARGEGLPPAGDPADHGEAAALDGRGLTVIPGLIDTHVCGMLGRDCREGTEAFDAIARGLPQFGVTGFLPTLLSMPSADAAKLVDEAGAAHARSAGCAAVLGIHLEGPYLGRPYRGLTLDDELAAPSVERDRALYERHPGLVKMMTLAPEVPGCLPYIAYLQHQGVVVSIGHTEIAGTEELGAAIEAGASHVTHVFNAMQPRVLKEPGVAAPGFADLALTDDRLSVSLIADGVHVCPELLRLLVKAKAHRQIILVTDCFPATAMPPGRYTFANGVEVVMDGTCHRTIEEGLLAGSVLTLNRAVRNVLKWTDMEIVQVLPMATYQPARLLGLESTKGALEVGKDADLAIVDEDWNVRLTMVAGRVVYDQSEDSAV